MRRWVLIIILFLVSAPAWAKNQLQKAEQSYKQMEYGKSLKMVKRILKRSDLGPRELISAFRVKGLCLSAMGRIKESVLAFRHLLAIDPSFKLPRNFSPKIAAPFYRAVAISQNMEAIGLSHKSTKEVESLRGLSLRVTLKSDPLNMVKSIRLRYRISESGAERRIATSVSGPSEVSIDLPSKVTAKEIYYYFEATNKTGAVLARAGERKHSFHLRAGAKAEATTEVVYPGGPVVYPDERGTWSHEGSEAGPAIESAVTVDPYTTWGHVSFWSGVGFTAFGGLSMALSIMAADEYEPGDRDAEDRSRFWAGMMYAGFGTGLALMATGVVLWLQDPSTYDQSGGNVANVAPTHDGLGVIFSFSKRW